MKLPGFFADAAVYRSSLHYRSVSGSSAGVPGFSPEAQIYPAVCSPYCGPCLPDDSSSTGCTKTCRTTACEDFDLPCRGCKITCSPGFSLCGTKCVDLSNDPANCGTCGLVCANGFCANGVCGCPPGLTACGGACVNLSNDPNNCGACGISCSGSGGVCTNSTCACPPGFAVCAITCTDLSSDPKNCGICGNFCATGVCANGTCVPCPPGLTGCLSGCTNLSSDPNNCGMCNVSCGGFGASCCGGKCTNLITDPMNCGSCGVNCGAGCCYSGFPFGTTCGVSVMCPTLGPSCCPTALPVCRSFFGSDFCSPF